MINKNSALFLVFASLLFASDKVTAHSILAISPKDIAQYEKDRLQNRAIAKLIVKYKKMQKKLKKMQEEIDYLRRRRYQRYRVISKWAHVRKTPEKNDNNIIYGFKQGTEIKVIGEKGRWLQLIDGNYIHKSIVKKEEK